MIRTEVLAMDGVSFAAERKGVLEQSDKDLSAPVRNALTRLGLPRWEEAITEAALKVFDQTLSAETDQKSQVIDDLRAEFARELGEALSKTKGAEDRNRQQETITRWVSTMAVNAATEAATTADPEALGLEWVTMSDSDVREIHRDAAGQIVPAGQPFSVGGEDLQYPGQPVGDPSRWINCRCVVRPTSLSESAGGTDEFANASDPSEQDDQPSAAVVVLLPREGDPVTEVSSGDETHLTLLYLGDGTMDLADLRATVGSAAKAIGHLITDKINGRATLGEDMADVALLDATGSIIIREWLLEEEPVPGMMEMQDQFPTWIPHVTLGYPDSPAAEKDIPEEITFDRLAVWRGTEQYEFPLDGELQTEESEPMPEKKVIHPEDEEFTQEMADGLIASIPENENPQPVDNPAEEPLDEAEIEDESTETIKLMDEEFPPVEWHAVLAPEGKMSGDGRMFSEGALTHRPLPLPLKWMPADAEGHKGSVVVGRIDRIFRHNGLVKASGVFDNSANGYEVLRQVAEQMLRGVSVDVDDVVGSADDGGDAMEFTSARVASSTVCAIPAFAEAYIGIGPWPEGEDEGAEDVIEQEEAGDGELVEMSTSGTFASSPPGLKKDGTPPKCEYCKNPATQYVLHSEGMAFTPACDEHIEQAEIDAARSVPGGEPDDGNIDRVAEYSIEKFDRVPVKTKDGPGWITDPKPTKRITSYWVDGRGAVKIGWGVPGDFNRCRVNLGKYVQNPDWLAGLCANLHYRALGVWPGQEAAVSGDTTVEMESIVASVSMAETTEAPVSADRFRNPELTGPTPLTITEDGQVYGHIATWDVCHIGVSDSCVNAPSSKTNYAYFLTGEVFTDAGPVAVGQITMGGGHADMRNGVRAAVTHYDSTSTAVADVTVGEDVFGIWTAGSVREGVAPDQVRTLRAAALSGDWRRVVVAGAGNLELVAALAVNVPGFPIPRASMSGNTQGQMALIAAAIPGVDGADVGDLSTRMNRVGAAKASLRTAKASRLKAQFNAGKGV